MVMRSRAHARRTAPRCREKSNGSAPRMPLRDRIERVRQPTDAELLHRLENWYHPVLGSGFIQGIPGNIFAFALLRLKVPGDPVDAIFVIQKEIAIPALQV